MTLIVAEAMESHAQPPLVRFLAAFWRDVENGAVRPLAEYQSLFPGDDGAIAREYAAVQDQRGGPPTIPDRHPPTIGAGLVGPYRLIREIGRGGQATVYLALDTRVARTVALKVLDPGPARTPEAIARFRREAAITSRLNHPAICPVHDVGSDQGVYFIAMRHVEGRPLARHITTAREPGTPERTVVTLDDPTTATPASTAGAGSPAGAAAVAQRVDIGRVLALVEATARGLHAAHECGVIHRDVKPGNIMVTPEGQPILLDFGLAQDVEGEISVLTRTGDFFGTPAYMSPEQLLAHRVRLDRRTDVWSLGVTLFECLTLRRPFDAPTRDGLYQAIQTKDPPDLRRLNPAASRALQVVVATALAKDRDRRYQTALAFAEDLHRVWSREPIVARPVGPWTRVRQWSQRNPALATALATLLVVLSAGLASSLSLLADRTTERNAKQAALDDYDRLGALPTLQRLTREADALWPAEPRNVASLERWVDDAQALLGRLPDLRAALARIPGRTSPDFTATDTRALRDAPFSPHPSPADQFKHDTLARIVDDLAAFADPDPARGTLASVRARLAFARRVGPETLDRYQAEWRQATVAIAKDPRYGGLRLAPELGLIPLGPDPESGLWEFVHLGTAAADADPIPRRDGRGRLIITADIGLVFVLLPGGSFLMGAKPAPEGAPAGSTNIDQEARENEAPLRTVALEPFFLSKYEMTQAQWQRVTGQNPSAYTVTTWKGVGPSNPVEQVTWDDCSLWMSRQGLMLPTEAQWEYGARAGTTTPWWTGARKEALARAANVADDTVKAPRTTWPHEDWHDGHLVHAPVGSFAPNAFGLHDTLGNVWEWCRDWYGSYDAVPDPRDGLRHPAEPRDRVYRGGSFGYLASNARSSYRNYYSPGSPFNDLGVRPARRVGTR